jgi:cysteine desulfurase family protein (TIGR01976 family)
MPSASAPSVPPQLDPGFVFPIGSVRASFPALARAAPFIYFDNAAGAQAPDVVLHAVSSHLLDVNVQRGGRYPKSVEVDRVIDQARRKVGVFLNAFQPEEVAFGMNATSFMRLASLALGQTLAGDRKEIIVTDLDHHANISTWLELEKLGARIVWWRARDDQSLHVEDLEALVTERTRLVACTVTSHALGTRVDVTAAARAAHAVGAEIFLDCVHFSPHALIDVRAWECDYLVCSGYKAFAPHMGFLWGRMEALERLPTFREEFIPDAPPHKIEAGTFIYENVAGMSAVVDYFEELGGGVDPMAKPGRERVASAMQAIEAYERTLSTAMVSALRKADAVIYGVKDLDRIQDRVPTFCFNLPGVHPARVAEAMAAADIGVRDGHMYAPRLMERLGLSMDSGAVRASLVHYNTTEEIGRFEETLCALAGSRSAVG